MARRERGSHKSYRRRRRPWKEYLCPKEYKRIWNRRDRHGDHVDPAEWGRLTDLLSRLPYDETRVPDDIPPLI